MPIEKTYWIMVMNHHNEMVFSETTNKKEEAMEDGRFFPIMQEKEGAYIVILKKDKNLRRYLVFRLFENKKAADSDSGTVSPRDYLVRYFDAENRVVIAQRQEGFKKDEILEKLVSLNAFYAVVFFSSENELEGDRYLCFLVNKKWNLAILPNS